MRRKKTDTIAKSFRIDKKLAKLFIATAQMRGETLKAIIEKAIRSYISNEQL